MFIKLLISLCSVSGTVRRLAWKWWYGRLAKHIDAANWTFMNYGFAPDGTEDPAFEPPELEDADEADRFCIQLYHRVVSSVPLNDLEVLEVGSGRGGGASFVARHHLPKKMTGIDFSPQAVELATKRHAAVANLEFITGDAEALPFPDASFDAVVNVESSHCYGNVSAFISEVTRVLRPGGHFLFADLRESPELEELDHLLRSRAGLEILEKENLAPYVLRALVADDSRKRKLMDENIPKKMRPVFEEFAGVAGGTVCSNFESGELGYVRYALKRL